MNWKERVFKIYHDWLEVFFYLCFFYSCGQITLHYWNNIESGVIIGFILFAIWAKYHEEHKKE